MQCMKSGVWAIPQAEKHASNNTVGMKKTANPLLTPGATSEPFGQGILGSEYGLGSKLKVVMFPWPCTLLIP